MKDTAIDLYAPKLFFIIVDSNNIVMAKRNLTPQEMIERWAWFSDAQACMIVSQRVYCESRAGKVFSQELPQ